MSSEKKEKPTFAEGADGKRKYRPMATQEDVMYLRNYASTKSDKELAEDLGGSIQWVRKIRHKYGIKKTVTVEEKKKGIKQKDIDEKNRRLAKGDLTAFDDVKDVASLIDNVLREYFENLFKNSSQYKMLTRMYTPDEIEYYLQEFSMHTTEIRKVGESINPQELRSLDTLIQTRIRMARLVADERDKKNLIEKIIKENGALTEDRVTDEIARNNIFMLKKDIEKVNKEWSELSVIATKSEQTLDITRQERVKRMSDAETGILRIIVEMQDKTKRERLEKQAAKVEISTKKLNDKWKKMICKDDEEPFIETNKDIWKIKDE